MSDPIHDRYVIGVDLLDGRRRIIGPHRPVDDDRNIAEMAQAMRGSRTDTTGLRVYTVASKVGSPADAWLRLTAEIPALAELELETTR